MKKMKVKKGDKKREETNTKKYFLFLDTMKYFCIFNNNSFPIGKLCDSFHLRNSFFAFFLLFFVM